jgi:hypothetical protein
MEPEPASLPVSYRCLIARNVRKAWFNRSSIYNSLLIVMRPISREFSHGACDELMSEAHRFTHGR